MHLFKRLGFLLILPALLLLPACDRHDDEDEHFGVVERIEVRNRANNALYAFHIRTQDDGWQGDGLPHLHVGEEIAVNVHFFDSDGHEAVLGTTREYQVGVRLATQAQDGVVGQAGIVDISAHGDHVDIEAEAEGETYIVFQLMHGNHSDADSPPLLIEVDDH